MEQVIRAQQKDSIRQGVVTGDEVFRFFCRLYLVAFAILPDWFGFYLGMLFSAKRIVLLLCYVLIIFNRRRLSQFWKMIRKLTVANIFVLLYMGVRLYTAIYRMNVQTFAGELLDGVMVFYFFCYLLKYEISTESLLKFLRIALLILCILGIFEYITQINLFSYLDTTNNFRVGTNIRGNLRLQGNCHHPIQFGIYIGMLFFLSCIDVENNRLYLFRHPVLLILSSICVFCSGSRGPLGIFIFGLVLICLFSKRDERIKSLVILLAIVALFVIVLLFIQKTSAGQWILQMLSSVVDSVFGTSLVNTHFSQLGVDYTNSTNYRDALAKVFELPYLNKLMGRGGDYSLSVVIDGYWLRSVDNHYVNTYVSYAYPGLITMVGLLLFGVLLSAYSAFKQRSALCACLVVVITCYSINLWFVAAMGTFMYFWMILAIAVITYQQNKIPNTQGGLQVCNRKK